jgi:hypothetical protein
MPLTLGLTIAVAGAFGSVQSTPVVAPVVHHVLAQAQTQSSSHQEIEMKAGRLRRVASFALATMSSPPDPTVEKAVASYFADIPIMINIASCESKFHQYDLNGNILTSATDDLGVMQINAPAHETEATTMGYDLTNLQGNLAFARYLYEQQGTDPWVSSSSCWGAAAAAGTNQLAEK